MYSDAPVQIVESVQRTLDPCTGLAIGTGIVPAYFSIIFRVPTDSDVDHPLFSSQGR